MANNRQHSINKLPTLTALAVVFHPLLWAGGILSYRYFEPFFLNLKHKFSSIQSGG